MHVQELVTVQQMANGNFVKQVVVRRNVWPIQVFFQELFLEET
jgi:hypothetical protein